MRGRKERNKKKEENVSSNKINEIKLESTNKHVT